MPNFSRDISPERIDEFLVEERVEIPGAHTGEPLRGELYYHEDVACRGRVLLSCPHPFLGGAPDNPVVRVMARLFAVAGLVVLVWEYRNEDSREEDSQSGAEKQVSAGSSLEAASGGNRLNFLRSDVVGQSRPHDIKDARRALAWLRAADLGDAESERLALAGYSYGGALSLFLAEAGLPVLSVSPPLRAMPPEWTIPHDRATVLYAADDLAVTPEDIETLEDRSSHRWAAIRLLEGCDHFYRDADQALCREIAPWIEKVFGRGRVS